jgi:hypothetical protein
MNMVSKHRITWIMPILALLILLGGCAREGVVTDMPEARLLHHKALAQLDQRVNPNEVMVYIDSGETIPVALTLESPLLALGQDTIDLVVKEKLYFRLRAPEVMSEADWQLLESIADNKMMELSSEQMEYLMNNYMVYVSRDAKAWAPLNDGDAVKEVLGIERGEFSFGMAAGTDEGIHGSAKVVTTP